MVASHCTHPRPAWALLRALGLAGLLTLAGCQAPGEPSAPTVLLEGRVLGLEHAVLPPGALLDVRLIEPAVAGPRGIVAAEQMPADVEAAPLSFEIAYDPRRLAPGRVHRLEVEISLGGEVWFRGARSVAGLHAGPPSTPLELRVHPVLRRGRA